MQRQLIYTLLKKVHRIYKTVLSPLFGSTCRFSPSCSDYFLKAVEAHGICRGLLLGCWRILRCNPWCKGGIDPVPEKLDRKGFFKAA
ncbi:MAG: membrane protein insertion efficiency factor YidD [Candidatus Dadabacteria bacterium]|nr:MAG: membrane protein insertion efficiency factor YidD [Candidatus Dadabacteria bacterium]